MQKIFLPLFSIRNYDMINHVGNADVIIFLSA